jgi:uncharacterized membrane protein YcaP (DUF421 family)
VSTVLTGAAVYVALLFAMRITQKRAITAMTPFEFLLLLMIGGAAVPTILGEDRSLTKAIVFIATLLATHFSIALCKARFPSFGKVVDGTPIVIIANGEPNRKVMRQMLITDEDILTSARDKGVLRLDQVRYAIVERNGALVVIPKDDS